MKPQIANNNNNNNIISVHFLIKMTKYWVLFSETNANLDYDREIKYHMKEAAVANTMCELKEENKNVA